ncbi:glycerol-3-phosphate dehydrogenase, putative [Schistosoma mansoni]|nr:glycerol-3-phosphate dehydrogenase, putative [Schistosoma mansoni]|eukprot:XP_018645456.1 glycerol-3-phosphate dehydrogenase, putative [Schistosoma mansoni]
MVLWNVCLSENSKVK